MYGGASLASLNQWSASQRLLRISDIATVTDAFEPQRQYSYVNSAQTISLGVQKAANASEVTAAENVLKALPAIEQSLSRHRLSRSSTIKPRTPSSRFGASFTR